MGTRRWGGALGAFALVALLVGCGGPDDAPPVQPQPGAPDAGPGTPDAGPGAPDAGPGTPDADGGPERDAFPAPRDVCLPRAILPTES